MVIIAGKPGQLGNRLFLFAHFVAGAEAHNFRVMNPSFDDYADYFEATAGDLFCRYPARRSRLAPTPSRRKLLYQSCYLAARLLARAKLPVRRARTVVLDWNERLDLGGPEFLSQLAPRQLLFAQGWLFRDELALAAHATLVRDLFRPREQYAENVRRLVARAREGADVLVGVHVRHGDYRTFQGGKYFYEVEAYAALMSRARELFPQRRVAFLVCSNAEHDEEAFGGPGIFRGAGHLIEDLYALAACDYLVGPPSTYTMWASFYGGAPLYQIEDARRVPRLEDFVAYGAGTVVGAATG